jgi:proteic killer suppression protein
MKCEIELSKKAKRDLEKLPHHIKLKLQVWVDTVERMGLLETRKIPSFHDEPLKGKRVGQRSIRLNIAYRAIYEVTEKGEVHLISIVEINKHDY